MEARLTNTRRLRVVLHISRITQSQLSQGHVGIDGSWGTETRLLACSQPVDRIAQREHGIL